MKWLEVRRKYPDQWLIIEALQAHTTPESRRILDAVKVVKRCDDSAIAMQVYRQLHEQYPEREFYFAHTSREQLDIRERVWAGIRRGVSVFIIARGRFLSPAMWFMRIMLSVVLIWLGQTERSSKTRLCCWGN